jgi:serine/threonine protein kinase
MTTSSESRRGGANDLGYVGRYRLLEPLGQGGVGVVYRAVHEATGEIVALKTVRVASEGKLASVRREIQALGRIRHPGIVRILDGGVSEGRPWYAMELLEGGTLREHLGARLTYPVSVTTEETRSLDGDFALPAGADEPGGGFSGLAAARAFLPLGGLSDSRQERAHFLTLIRRLCEPLAYLHGEGLIHRDIKPSNILIRADGTPVLMDFGLVWLLQGESGREVLTVDAARGGTITYMAPEQALGDRIDARADLFSLGCIIYESITGQRAFPAENRRELVAAHARRPPLPSQLVDDVSPALDALIMGLLAPQPRDRIGHASDVAALLADLGAEASPTAPATPAKAYLYRPELVGRGALLDGALAHLSRLQDGQGSCLLVAGESGIGKTSFVSAVAHLAGARGVRVVTGECAAVGVVDGRGLRQGGPLYPLARLLQAVGDRCVAGGAALTAKMLGERAKVLAATEPSLRQLPDVQAYPEPAEVPGEAARRRLIDAMAETLAAFAEDRPTLLVLDDLQWADDLTLAFLSALSERYYAANRLLVIATYRSEESTPDLDRLAAQPHVAHLRLDRLDAATIGSMSADMLGQRQMPGKLAAFLTEESSGNPFFVAEYLRAAVDAGLLFRDDRGRWQQGEGDVALDRLGLPRTLQALVTRRLGSLVDTSRRLSEVAAVLGREVDVEVLCAVALSSGVASDEGDFEQILRNLLVRQVLETTSSGAVRFVHDKLREIEYGGLPPERQAELHGAAAALLERRHAQAGTLDAVSATLAHHFEKANQLDRALFYFDKAGEAAHAVYANQEAHRLLDRARALDESAATPSSSIVRARRERLLGLNALALGNLNGALASLTRATNVAGRPWPRSRAGLVVRCVLALGGELVRRLLPAASVRGDGAPGEDGADGAVRGGPARDLLLEAARAYERLAVVHYFATSDMLSVVHASLTNTGLAERAGGASAELALGYATLASMCAMVPIDGAAQRYGQRAMQAAALAGDDAAQTWVFMNVAVVHLLAGRWRETSVALDAVAALSRRMGFSRRWEECMAQLGTSHFLEGRFQDAHDVNEAFLAAIERADPQTKCWAVVKRAELALAKGDVAQALRDALEGERLCRQNLGRAEWIYTLGPLALAHLRSGNPQEARAAADQWAEWVARGSAPTFYNVFAYSAAAEVYLALWREARDEAERRPLGAALRRAVRHLRANGRGMAIAAPRAWLWRGIAAAHLDGQRSRALRFFRESLERARRLQMPHDEAMALAALGEHAADAAERRAKLDEATAIFARLGASHDLWRVERLRAL